jgi:hypothetical protein
MLKAINWIVQQFQIGPNVAGTGPAFSAYANATVTLNNSVFTKIALQVEEFDTNGNFDSTTNYRFQPTIAGYYQISGGTTFQPIGAGNRFLALYKNGSVFKYFGVLSPASVNFTQMYGSCLVYLNGSTDFVELYALQNGGGNITNSASNNETYFQGVLTRAA